MTNEEECKVIVNPTEEMVSCSCRLFERIGILCRHALKGLNLVKIKHLPERYILKLWTRDARSGIIQDMNGREIVENPKLDATLRDKGNQKNTSKPVQQEDGSHVPESQAYESISSFTQILMVCLLHLFFP